MYLLPLDVEEQRCRAVEQLYLLDTPPEQRFAQITRMVRTALEVPMAAISLLDRDRQWFKQVDGLEVSSSVRRLKQSAQHPNPEDLCARVRALAAAKATLDDITIVAIRRDLPP
jgi:hypothetical protein